MQILWLLYKYLTNICIRRNTCSVATLLYKLPKNEIKEHSASEYKAHTCEARTYVCHVTESIYLCVAIVLEPTLAYEKTNEDSDVFKEAAHMDIGDATTKMLLKKDFEQEKPTARETLRNRAVV